MPVLILLGLLGVWGAVNLKESSGKNTHAYSKTELDNMLGQMIGKSEREARKIARMYRK